MHNCRYIPWVKEVMLFIGFKQIRPEYHSDYGKNKIKTGYNCYQLHYLIRIFNELEKHIQPWS